MQKPVGAWHMVSCEKCGLLVGWTRAPLERAFYCIPCFDLVAHVPDDEVSVREATHVRLHDGTVEKIASKWGIDPSGVFKKGGFGVVTETGKRIPMFNAHSYLKRGT